MTELTRIKLSDLTVKGKPSSNTSNSLKARSNNISPDPYNSIQSFKASVPPKKCTCRPNSGPCRCNPPNVGAKWIRPVLASKQLASDNVNPTYASRVTQSGIGKCGKAWVESEIDDNGGSGDSAEYYTYCMEQVQRDKAERLKEFRKQVQLRVNRLEMEKKEEVMKKLHQNMELERIVARKTAFLAQASMPYASDVMVKGRKDMIVKNTDLHLPEENENANNKGHIQQVQKSVDQFNQVKKYARLKLKSRQVGIPQDIDLDEGLPGGLWRSGVMLDLADDGIDEEDTLHGAPSISDDVNDVIENNERETKFHKQDSPIRISAGRVPQTDIRIMMSRHDDEEIRKQEVKQRALLRRLYMDMEREQVKDYKKVKEHNDRIARIKRDKEEARKKAELEADIENLPRPPQPDPNKERIIRETQKQIQKDKEAYRYIKALRSLLREKIDKSGVEVPPLCSCGPTVWDTHPDMCANNCIFYRNPRAYERAMNALLTSCGSKWD